jgi:hypothetical protein
MHSRFGSLIDKTRKILMDKVQKWTWTKEESTIIPDPGSSALSDPLAEAVVS